MGILDDAIREHLELKRQHGAEEKEIEGLEAEAFGPADRPDAVEPESGSVATAEAGTGEQPAGPPDFLDSSPAAAPSPEGEAEPEPAAAGDDPEPPAASPPPAAAEETTEAEPLPPADPVGATVPDVVDGPDGRDRDDGDAGAGESDAGDLLEAERQRLANHPTEHYDVDAAIAEEDELDVLSESSLSDELDRALEGPVEPVSEEFAPDPHSEDEPLTSDPPREGAVEEIEDAEYEAVMETAPEDEPEDQNLEEQEESDDPPADFFDQEDPLEGTPDFLEETPEHDRLWFEQKEPKDFDFGD